MNNSRMTDKTQTNDELLLLVQVCTPIVEEFLNSTEYLDMFRVWKNTPEAQLKFAGKDLTDRELCAVITHTLLSDVGRNYSVGRLYAALIMRFKFYVQELNCPSFSKLAYDMAGAITTCKRMMTEVESIKFENNS